MSDCRMHASGFQHLDHEVLNSFMSLDFGYKFEVDDDNGLLLFISVLSGPGYRKSETRRFSKTLNAPHGGRLPSEEECHALMRESIPDVLEYAQRLVLGTNSEA